MNNMRVVVTGMGVISPVGNDIETFWRCLCQGQSGIVPVTSFDAAKFPSRIAGEVKDFDPSCFVEKKDIKKMDKFVQYGMAAAKMAMEDAGLDIHQEDPHKIGVVVGSGIGGLESIEKQHNVYLDKGPGRMSPFLIPMLISNILPGFISMYYGMKGPNFSVVTACATGNHTIGISLDLLRHGKADVMICGGAEAANTRLAFGGFCAMRALSQRNDEPQKASRPFDRDRDGFVMSEGAGILILETLEHAQKRKARMYAEVKGFGMTADAFHITKPAPNAEGSVRAMKLAIEDAQIPKEKISYINAHGTSTKYNDVYETVAIKQVFGDHAKKIPINSTKSMTGHMLGAAGGIESIVSILSIGRGQIHPTINLDNPDPECDLDYVAHTSRDIKLDTVLSNSLGFGGHNAALIFSKL